MPTRTRNTNYYLQRRLDRELEKSIDAIIKRRLREHHPSQIPLNMIDRNNRKAFNEFSNTVFKDHIKQVDIFSSFGNTQSQFFNTFSMELNKSIFRNLF